MNGRIYDPLLGRFLSADLVVQAPGSLQSYNRYSYVLNNPLTLTDPTGFYFMETLPGWAQNAVNSFAPGLAQADRMIDIGIEAKAVYTTVRSDNDGAGMATATAAGVVVGRITGAMDWAEAVHGEKIVVSNGQASTTEITSPTEVAVKALGGAAGMTLTGVGGAKSFTALTSSEGSATAAAQTTTQEARAVAGTSAADSRMAQGTPKTRAVPELKTSSAEGTKPAATEKLSKVEKSKTVEQIGDSRFTRTTEVRPGNGPGQTRAEYVRIKDEKGNVIKTYKDTFDRANKFQHRKPLRGGPEGRPQNE